MLHLPSLILYANKIMRTSFFSYKSITQFEHCIIFNNQRIDATINNN